MPPKGKNPNLSVLAGIGAEVSDFIGSNPVAVNAGGGIQVEYIHLDMIRPDPANPRRVLPQHLYEAFHNQQIRPEQALRQFIGYTKEIAKSHGRGFGSLLDLLPTSDEKDDETPLTPEEKTLRDLVVLADTLRNDSQVNPITVIQVGNVYLIETGERRYWASWILRDLPGYSGDGTIPCLNVTGKSSVFRAAKENTSRAGLNAMAMARQIALLLLAVHGVDAPMGPVPNEWYRQAVDLDLRAKREYTTEIMTALGGIHRRDFSRYKALLNLCDEAMELADRYQLEERKLRPLVEMPSDGQMEILRPAIEHGWDARQIEVAATKWRMGEKTKAAPPEKLPAQARQMAKIAGKNLSPRDIAAAIIEEEPDVDLALGRLRSLRRALQEAESYLVKE